MATPFPFTSGQTLTAAQMNAVTTLPVSTKTASYTAVVGDVGSRIVMNVASANTVTINNSIFAEGDTIFIANKGAGATTVTAGAGVTINTSGSLILAQHGGGTLVALSASVFTFFSGGTSYGIATGGSSSSITVSGINYTLLTFTTTGTLTVTKSGLFDVLNISGGGGGGTGISLGRGGGGGGGGGNETNTIYLDANQTITVGAGGAFNTIGNRSQIGTLSTVIGGGLGGHLTTGDPSNTKVGACGGGAFSSAAADTNTGGPKLEINGSAGGNGAGASSSNAGSGGGGGATAAGGNGSGTTNGAGGAGVDVSTFIGGSALFKCGGGGGGGLTGGAGGSSVGGAGGTGNNVGASASANTGSGGGGGGDTTNNGGAGGSGIVFIRFKA